MSRKAVHDKNSFLYRAMVLYDMIFVNPIIRQTVRQLFHDRFIVLDYGTADERVFLCGASSKDAGARITSIVEDYGISKYAPVIATLLKNPTLILPQ